MSLPQVTVNPKGVAAATQGVDGGPGLSGLVVQTSTSLGLLFPSVFEAISYKGGAIGGFRENDCRLKQMYTDVTK